MSRFACDPFCDPTAFGITPERLKEIREIRATWRLNDIGTVDCRTVDPLVLALDELLAETERQRSDE